MKRAMKWVLLAISALLMATPVLATGCRSDEEENGPLEGPLRSNQAKWTAAKATDYTFTLRIGCF